MAYLVSCHKKFHIPPSFHNVSEPVIENRGLGEGGGVRKKWVVGFPDCNRARKLNVVKPLIQEVLIVTVGV